MWKIVSCAVLALALVWIPSNANAQNALIFSSGFESAAPIVLYTDLLSGPNTGGENNHGVYLSIFGKNFGNEGLGSSLKVYLNGSEVAAYKSLGTSRGRADIQQLSVQLGALGGAPAGVPLAIKVIANGLASNTDHSFTIHPGRIFYVDSSNGVDTATNTGGGFSDPFRTVQKPAGVSTSFNFVSASVGGAWGRLQAGDVLVLRGGDYTTIGFGGTQANQLGYFLQTLNKSGCPLGNVCAQGGASAGGTGSGPITIMGYPGETAFIKRINTQGNNNFGGGISSADSARQQAGYGARFTISNLRIEAGFTDGAINVQRAEDNPLGAHWRVINNELTTTSCNTSTLCRAGAISGSGVGNVWLGNYGHDIYDVPDANTSLENHGVYIGGGGSFEIAYNVFADVYGGNGIQVQSFSNVPLSSLRIHHNLIRNLGKHGLNFAAGVGNGVVVWNNLIVDSDFAGVRFQDDAMRNFKLYNNTFFNIGRLGNAASGAVLTNDTNAAVGMFEFRNNIFVANPIAGYNSGCCNANFAGSAAASSHNLWFGAGAAPSFDSNSVSANAGFVASPLNLKLSANSPAINAGVSPPNVASVVLDDYEVANVRGNTIRPRGAAIDIGAYEFEE
jgi:hypothetical protein